MVVKVKRINYSCRASQYVVIPPQISYVYMRQWKIFMNGTVFAVVVDSIYSHFTLVSLALVFKTGQEFEEGSTTK